MQALHAGMLAPRPCGYLHTFVMNMQETLPNHVCMYVTIYAIKTAIRSISYVSVPLADNEYLLIGRCL